MEKEYFYSRPTAKEQSIELTLCPICAKQFYGSKKHHIRRSRIWQSQRDVCTYCNIRYGFDYLITDIDLD